MIREIFTQSIAESCLIIPTNKLNIFFICKSDLVKLYAHCFYGKCSAESKTNKQTKTQKKTCRKTCHLFYTNSISDHMTCNTDYQCSAWTGLNDIDTEGRYVWDHSNAIALFTNWYPGEPRDIEDLTRDCIDMLRNGQWNDRPCSSLRSFICEKSI